MVPRFHPLVVLTAAALAAAGAVAAPADAASRLWIGVHGGYRMGGTLGDIRHAPRERPVSLRLEAAPALGAEIAYVLHDQVLLAFRYDRQDSEFTDASSDPAGFRLTLDHVHGGVIFRFPRPEITPLLSLSLGAAFLRPEPDRDALRRFSWGAGLGLERDLGARFRLRAETRLTGISLGSDRDAFCGPGTDCYNTTLSTWLWQGEGTLGLTVGF